MKNVILLVGLMMIGNGYGQVSKIVKQAPANYLVALHSENQAIVESAIFYSVKFKLFYEDQDCEALRNELKELSINGKSETIRLKAFLAGYFLNNPELLTKIEKVNYKDSNLFFQMLANTLQEKILADRSE
jgi:PAB1-binding protein PBP1